MALTRRMAVPVVLLVAVLVATEMGAVSASEPGECVSQSHGFRGMCFSSSNCEKVCAAENFPGGECKMHNALRKCFCKKPC